MRDDLTLTGDINNKIGFTDGIMGSTGLDKLKEQNTGGNNPGVEGALDVDPDVIGALAASQCLQRHRRDSCPSHDAVGGFFVEFELIR